MSMLEPMSPGRKQDIAADNWGANRPKPHLNRGKSHPNRPEAHLNRSESQPNRPGFQPDRGNPTASGPAANVDRQRRGLDHLERRPRAPSRRNAELAVYYARGK